MKTEIVKTALSLADKIPTVTINEKDDCLIVESHELYIVGTLCNLRSETGIEVDIHNRTPVQGREHYATAQIPLH